MEATIKCSSGYDFTISDADVVNPGEYIPRGEYNPHHIRPWVTFGHTGFVLGVVFASCEQNALDELADNGRLNDYRVSATDLSHYGEEEEGIMRLGNAGEPFDIDSLGMVEIENPAFSFCALLMADRQGGDNA